jgi:hypothetical protein
MWALPLEGDRREPFPVLVLQTDFDEGLAQFSPDGNLDRLPVGQDGSP